MGTGSQSGGTPTSGSASPRRHVILSLVLLLLLQVVAMVTGQSDEGGGDDEAIVVVEYEILEDQVAGTWVGTLIPDALLDQRYPQSVLDTFRFQLIAETSDHVDLFNMEQDTGVLRTTEVIDRDRICPRKESCVIHLEISVQPWEYFQIIKVDIAILDRNDNHPTFPEARISLAISEIATPGATFNLPVADDLDGGLLGIQRYELQSPTTAFDLRISDSTPQLLLKERLDREETEYFSLKVLAYDGGNPPGYGQLVVDISVVDANDNTPTFQMPVYDVTLQEDAEVGGVVVRVHAYDPDDGENGQLVYSFSRMTTMLYGHIFGINAETGDIILQSTLNHQDNSEFQLGVVAYDNGPSALSGNAKVIITIHDVNDHPPEIKASSLTESGNAEVSEMATMGAFVGHISVVDPDSGRSGKFSCSLESNYFALRSMGSGGDYKILTTARFDRETRDRYDVVIRCRDFGEPSLSASRHIAIIVLDENDHDPEFSEDPYSFTIPENNEISISIGQVNATDMDSGLNAEIEYELVAPEGYHPMLAINSRTGVVYTAASFDHESKNQYEYHVIARDAGTPSRSATATIMVRVLDSNDEPPRFQKKDFVFGTFENQPVGTEIGTVVAYDPDGSPYNEVTYRLDYLHPDSRTFAVDSLTGRITTRRFLDRESKQTYHVIIVAENPGYALSSSANVTIQVADKNDNGPRIHYPTSDNNTVEITSLLAIGDVVMRVNASDADIGRNAELRYSVVEGDEERVFEIHPQEGALMVNRNLRPYGNQWFQMRILVEDRGLPQMSAVTDVGVYINGTAAAILEQRASLGYHTLLVIVVATSLAFVLVVALLAALVMWRRRRGRHSQQHKYNCRVEADKMLRGMKAGPNAPSTSAATPVSSSGGPGGGGSQQSPNGKGAPPPRKYGADGTTPKGGHGGSAGDHHSPWTMMSYVDSIDVKNPQAHSTILGPSVVEGGHTPLRSFKPADPQDPRGFPDTTQQCHSPTGGGRGDDSLPPPPSGYHEQPRHRLLYQQAPPAARRGDTTPHGEDHPADMQVHEVLEMLHGEGGSDRGSLTDSGKGPSEEGDGPRRSPIEPLLWTPEKAPTLSTFAPPKRPPRMPTGQSTCPVHANSTWQPPRADTMPTKCRVHSNGQRPSKDPYVPNGRPNNNSCHSSCIEISPSDSCGKDWSRDKARSPDGHLPCPVHPRRGSDNSLRRSHDALPVISPTGSSDGRLPRGHFRSRLADMEPDIISDDGTTTSGSYVVDLTEVEEGDCGPQISKDVYV